MWAVEAYSGQLTQQDGVREPHGHNRLPHLFHRPNERCGHPSACVLAGSSDMRVVTMKSELYMNGMFPSARPQCTVTVFFYDVLMVSKMDAGTESEGCSYDSAKDD